MSPIPTHRRAAPRPLAASLSAVSLLSVLAALLGGCTMPQPEGEALGRARYETCATCHGDDGGGNRTFAWARPEGTPVLGAPAIAGMPLWYVQRQLEKYRDGHRGNDPEDYAGLRMRAMVRTLNHEGDLEAVARYVSAMPAVTPEATFTDGDASAGASAFGTCVECHGERAQGNEARNAPPLTGLNDWYIVAQLQLFKSGDRGTTPGDVTGAEMRPMALGVADEQAMRNLAAHIATLRSGGN